MEISGGEGVAEFGVGRGDVAVAVFVPVAVAADRGGWMARSEVVASVA